MTNFVFKEYGWKASFIPGFTAGIIFSIANNYFGLLTAALTAGAITFLVVSLSNRFVLTKVIFEKSCLKHKKAFSNHIDIINYADINRMSYTYDRFHNFYIYTNKDKIKLPSPGSLKRAQELFSRINSNYPHISTEIFTKETSPVLGNRYK
jgi:hypothetical protein